MYHSSWRGEFLSRKVVSIEFVCMWICYFEMNSALDVGDLVQAWYLRRGRCSVTLYLEAMN